MVEEGLGSFAISGDNPSSSQCFLISLCYLAETVEWSCNKKCSERDMSSAERQHAHMAGASPSVKECLCKVILSDTCFLGQVHLSDTCS